MALADGLAAAGVDRVVISPGSRSTPLTLACERHPRMRTWVQVDERSAAFFALGLAKADGYPVALICTSGSAPANWYPAVVEANYGMTPLILLTADRPPELRECGANQAIDQIKFFAGQVRASHELPVAEDSPEGRQYLRFIAARAVDQSRWPLPGPVHVNVPLREPLVPPGGIPEDGAASSPVMVGYPRLVPAPEEVADLAERLSGRRGVIVCGDGAHGPGFATAVARLAERLDCPVLADPLSNLRFGPHDRSRIFSHYDAFLRSGDFVREHIPEWVLRFGAMPVSQSLQRFLAAAGQALHIVVEGHGRWPDPVHRATHVFRAHGEGFCSVLEAAVAAPAPVSWLQAFKERERRAEQLIKAEGTDRSPYEGEVIRSLLANLPDGATLFSGNSMAIRELDTYAAGSPRRLRIVANRGASGIDGNISTLLGLVASGVGPVAGLVGDLTFYHDMNGLLAARGLTFTLIVLNNGGGGIFSYLPQADLEDFDRAWLTPTSLDFSYAARMYGLHFRRVERQEAFEGALAEAFSRGGPNLIEVIIDREASVARHREYWAAVAEKGGGCPDTRP
jgi:2-succinyl-5-enolpyruvyl-6-hydroxy-3-cyclohexene-1-carboxylate synthase